MKSTALATKHLVLGDSDAAGFRYIQRLAYQAVQIVGRELREGVTEKQAADMVGTYLKDHGVKAFFHEPYAWFGDRTRFAGIQRLKYSQFDPTYRKLKAEDVIILDVAPILEGYVGDIGYTFSLEENSELRKAQNFLKQLRKDIPRLFQLHKDQGGVVWKMVDGKIKAAGYDNIHQIYPFHVLGHRIRRLPLSRFALRTPTRFSLHSFFQVFSHGLFPELLNATHKGSMNGFWAVEPHIGGNGFGAKFEEILVIQDNAVHWLDDQVPHK